MVRLDGARGRRHRRDRRRRARSVPGVRRLTSPEPYPTLADEVPAPPLAAALAEVVAVFALVVAALLLTAPALEGRGAWAMLVWLGPPIALIAWRREDPLAALGLAPRRTLRGVGLALSLAATVLPAYAVVLAAWRTGGARLVAFDPGVAASVFAMHLIYPALHEEAFFRGWIVARLLGPGAHVGLRPRARVALVVVVQAALFGLAHVALSGWDLSRMDTALPAIAFFALRAASSDIWGAVIFHAACNATLFGVNAGLGP